MNLVLFLVGDFPDGASVFVNTTGILLIGSNLNWQAYNVYLNGMLLLLLLLQF